MQSPSRHSQQTIDRRHFLSRAARGTAAGIAAATVFGHPFSIEAEEKTAEKKKCWKMKLSGSTINYTSLSIEETCARLADVGVEAVDVWSGHAGCPHLDDVLTRLGPDGLKELLQKHKLKLYSFSVYRGGYAKYAELLGKAGGGVAIHGSSGPCDPKDLTTRMKAYLEALKPEIELAEKFDSYLAIENHGHALLDSLDSFKAFVDLNTHPRVGIALAPYHVQGQGESVEKAITTCGKQLFYFYAWQRAGGTGQLPGIGPVDCAPWLAALAKIDYPWYVNPFMHHEPKPDAMSEALATSCKYLKSIAEKL